MVTSIYLNTFKLLNSSNISILVILPQLGPSTAVEKDIGFYAIGRCISFLSTSPSPTFRLLFRFNSIIEDKVDL
jgi:hypothetical protein